MDEPLRGGDKSAPEHLHGRLCNPFHTDIYYLGNLVRERFIKVIIHLQPWVGYEAYAILQVYNGFEFMLDLVDEMTKENPVDRPTIEEVITMFSSIRDSLSEYKLRSLIMAKKDPRIITTYRYARQVVRTVEYLILQKAAIPYA